MERKVAAIGYNDRSNPDCTLSDLLRTRKVLQVLTISPAFVGRAARPRATTPPANAMLLRLPKRGGAGGPPLSSPCGFGASGWRHGVGRQEPTPSHSRAVGGAPCFGLPTNAGGGEGRTTEPGRVADAPRYSHGRVLTTLARPFGGRAVYWESSSGAHSGFRGSHNVPRRHATPGTPGGSLHTAGIVPARPLSV